MLAEPPQAAAIDAAAEVPLALYVHFPWCVQKCPYCDFNSHRLDGVLEETRYVDALVADLAFELEGREPRPLSSIFLGGGTPSLFSGAAVGRLLEAVAGRLALAAGAEVTLEANPGTADAGHFRGYRAVGVNRLSLGVQSFDDAMLHRLGRIHDGAQAAAAVALARAAGFDNLNLDLMYGLPGQTLEAALADVERALALAPAHLSWYHLTLEPHTPFHRNPPPALPDADAVAAIEEAGRDRLCAAGFEHYEVSAYARPGRHGRHNLNYWRFGDYLALGAGAHGKWSDAGGVLRRVREPHPRRYLEAAGTPRVLRESRRVAVADLAFEFALNGLRLQEGFSLVDFERRTGVGRAALAAGLARTQRLGLTARDGERVRCTARGFAFLNDTVEAFLP